MHTSPTVPVHLVALVDADAINMGFTKKTLARLDDAVNFAEESRSIQEPIYCAAWPTKSS